MPLQPHPLMSQYNAFLAIQFHYHFFPALSLAIQFFFLQNTTDSATNFLYFFQKKFFIMFFFPVISTGDTKIYIHFFFSNTSNKFIQIYFHSFFFNFTHCKTLRKIFLLINFFFHFQPLENTKKKKFMPIFFYFP